MHARILLLSSALLLAAPATAQQPAMQSERGSWNISCADALPGAVRPCQLSTTITAQPGNQRLAQVILTRQPETRSLGLVFQVPHGTLLPAGVTWQVDNAEAQRIALQTSDAEGLYTGVPVTDELLAALRRASVLRIVVVVAATRDTLILPVPMNGFTEAVTQLFAAERSDPTPR